MLGSCFHTAGGQLLAWPVLRLAGTRLAEKMSENLLSRPRMPSVSISPAKAPSTSGCPLSPVASHRVVLTCTGNTHRAECRRLHTNAACYLTHPEVCHSIRVRGSLPTAGHTLGKLLLGHMQVERAMQCIWHYIKPHNTCLKVIERVLANKGEVVDRLVELPCRHHSCGRASKA